MTRVGRAEPLKAAGPRELLATLVTRAPEHLLVLLLAHALAALLDQRTHKGVETTVPTGKTGNPLPFIGDLPGSSNWQDSGFWSR
jgi:hypothetical protein